MLHRNLRYFAKMDVKRKHELIGKLEEWKKYKELKKKVLQSSNPVHGPNLVNYMEKKGQNVYEDWLSDNSFVSRFIMIGMDNPQNYFQMQQKS